MTAIRRTADRWRQSWKGAGGGAEVLRFATPLILSQLTFTLQMVIDRVFLTWYGAEAVAAASASLFVTLVPILACAGTGEYATALVAQYDGARRPERIGAVMWQGIWFAVFAGGALAALAPAAASIFDVAGHAPALRADEAAFARVLLRGAFPIVLMPTLASFFAGRGATRTVFAGNVLAAVANVGLDWMWIFGRLGFPEGGVVGAALATVTASMLGSAFFLVLMLRRRARAAYGTLRSWRLEPALLARLVRLGAPAGSQFPLEILGVGLFTLVVGRLGTRELAATALAFSLNGLVFLPMVGLGLGVTALTGRYQGAARADLAERVTWTAFGWSLAYMVAVGLVYLLLPRVLLFPYAVRADATGFAPIADTTVVLLRFIAVYSIFDMMNAIFAAGLRGAGDTTFPVLAAVAASWGIMVVPTWIACTYLGAGLLAAWTFASLDFVVLGLAMLARYRSGRWRTLRVIEPAATPLIRLA